MSVLYLAHLCMKCSLGLTNVLEVSSLSHHIVFYHVSLIYYICVAAAAAAQSLQSCPTLCDPIDGSPPGSPVPGILQARALEWAAISFSNAWKGKGKVKSLNHVRLLATTWTAAYQAPPAWDFPGKSTGVGCRCLLRIIYLPTYIIYLSSSYLCHLPIYLSTYLFTLSIYLSIYLSSIYHLYLCYYLPNQQLNKFYLLTLCMCVCMCITHLK